jgi:hypothetical protein
MFSAFVPSLLAQTTQRLRNEMCPSSSIPFNILCSQPDNYRNWLMLQEIVQNQQQTNESNESDEFDEMPLDLSLKLSADGSTHTRQSMSKLPRNTLSSVDERDLTKYSSLNTMDLVRIVKDVLNRHSISQRHFGEKILGLSQGSVRYETKNVRARSSILFCI